MIDILGRSLWRCMDTELEETGWRQGTTQRAPTVIHVRDDGGLSQDGPGDGRGSQNCHLFGRWSSQDLLKNYIVCGVKGGWGQR